jgi:endonuclease YncB( thermonuclease family)
MELLPVGATVTLVSKGLLGSFEKYGRVLADLRFHPPSEPPDAVGDFAAAMLAAGVAKPWDGRGAKPT